jgi:hypothetical protein
MQTSAKNLCCVSGLKFCIVKKKMKQVLRFAGHALKFVQTDIKLHYGKLESIPPGNK